MQLVAKALALCAFSASLAGAKSFGSSQPFRAAFSKRQNSGNSSSSLQVDLGYEVYNGVSNSSTGLNTWKGIRYAAPPTGTLRWQPPQTPAMNRSQTIQANTQPPHCPQSGDAPLSPTYNFTMSGEGSEDCLFLNVYAPPNASNLPVFVYIHGGGYGGGAATSDPSDLINTNNNGMVAVIIQYRLGAFGFMSSDEIHRYGVVNAGLLDQNFALQWVQSYISLFGGNSSQVTIGGESAGGGSVMLQAMAFGGYQREELFSNVIAESPYLPMQYGYADFVPSQSYYAFAQAVGCFGGINAGGVNTSIFSCLVSKDTLTLQNASAVLSASGKYGTWGFLPVTDGVFIQQLPSQQLLSKSVNGLRILSGNNANEGPAFTPQNISTEDEFVTYLQNTFPLFTDDDISKVLMYYPSTNASVNPSTPDFSTLGYTGPTALNESEYGTGQQQRADNVYAETTFVCPSYWLAQAYTNNGRQAWKYQYSVPPANHGSDVSSYFPPSTPNQVPEFDTAFQAIQGAFIINNNPSISTTIAAGNNTNISVASLEFISNWPQFTTAQPYQVNLNITGGTPVSTAGITPTSQNVTAYIEPGVVNNFSLVNAYTWEANRGVRCDFWRSVGLIVPE
ncbi:MAG: hypothetical protein M1827_002191 [Pycnora praestabilis]|nr:MAG: hypothetical protein M1827_002191 [Pycnora praestabilis]